MKYLIPIFAVVFAACQAPVKPVVVEASPMHWVDSCISKIDSKPAKVITAIVPNLPHTDTFTYQLYFKDSIPLRISGKDKNLYFIDPDNYVERLHDSLYICYLQGNKLLRFYKHSMGPLYEEVSEDPQDMHGDELVKYIRDAWMAFPAFHFPAPSFAANNYYLLTIYEATPLFEKPDTSSRRLFFLQDSTVVSFNDAIEKKGIYKGKEWVWYQVTYNNTTTGWVVGHPEIIREEDN
jgi:hypothetical protein